MITEVETSERFELVEITDIISDAVPQSLETGICQVFVPHTTAGVIINEPETRLITDIERLLRRLVPRDNDYEHNAVDDNADAHLRSMLLGTSASIPVADGELALGTWQSVMLVEGDGPRRRQVHVTTVGH